MALAATKLPADSAGDGSFSLWQRSVLRFMGTSVVSDQARGHVLRPGCQPVPHTESALEVALSRSVPFRAPLPLRRTAHGSVPREAGLPGSQSACPTSRSGGGQDPFSTEGM